MGSDNRPIRGFPFLRVRGACPKRPPLSLKASPRSTTTLIQSSTACCVSLSSLLSSSSPTEKRMLRSYFLIFLLVAWVCGEAAAAYFKTWEDGEEVGRPPLFYLYNCTR
ncbi:hypothetical protein TNIN_99921 [Trichonephila inaurata madagascariensis]|uniref:Uncharacterized protein n=1 Tax=Trichonephila inaurata madagascariensis TaxID=2747483 RepID=A0A8X7CT94_9ARAC|nr:hypothetical protein TNIN_99921 [Trichonephila inaurata madagascariensis]